MPRSFTIESQNSIERAERKRYFVVGMHRSYAHFRFHHAEIRFRKFAAQLPASRISAAARSASAATRGSHIPARLEAVRPHSRGYSKPYGCLATSQGGASGMPKRRIIYLIKTIEYRLLVINNISSRCPAPSDAREPLDFVTKIAVGMASGLPISALKLAAGAPCSFSCRRITLYPHSHPHSLYL